MTDQIPPLRVLFLCTGNSARSQIAEALLLRKGAGKYHAASAGTEPAERVHPQALAALAEIGIDWTGRSPKGVDAASRESWDAIITTCDRARESCPAFPGQPVYAHWNIPDPAAEPPHLWERAFAHTVQSLGVRIDLMLAVRLAERRDQLQETIRMTETGAHRTTPAS